MKTITGLAFCTALLVAATALHAADYSDPTWPCIQRKVENLSLGLMWPHPFDPEAAVPAALAQEAKGIADILALRRVALEDVSEEVSAFAVRHDGQADALGLVFAQVFERLDLRRSRIISGIGRFSLGQIKLAEKIKDSRGAIKTELAADRPDFDHIDQLEESLDWDQLIYSDRQQAITYLCETPQLLERRLFAVAQLLSSHVAK